MLRSTDRIITTHVGSLARPHDLLDIMKEREHGRPYDAEAFAARVQSAVSDVVREQADAGIDVVTDGEMGKVSLRVLNPAIWKLSKVSRLKKRTF